MGIDETTFGFPGTPGEEPRRSDRASPDWTGGSVAHYRILEEIGRGGMGLVFRAEDTRLLRTVALKFLPPSLTRDAVANERFLKEAQAASALDHPNIATVHELGESADGQLFLAMSFYDGETLQAKIKRGPLPVREATFLTAQVAAGLSRTHQRGIIHRDIKPSNLMVTTDGIVKILDFGIAKLAGQEGPTREGLVLGTLAYMSPEQCSGREVDQRSDIWSLGIVLYAMLAGQPPFRGENDRVLIDAILHREPEPLRSVRPEVPATLERTVRRMLAKNPAERFQTMEDVRVDLGVSNLSLEAVIHQRLPRPARGSWRWAAGVGAAVLVAGLGAFALRPSPELGALPGVAAAGRNRPSIAVLPFENLSRDAAQDYMADGMTEALTTDLARLGGLKVVSRTSAEHYRATAKTLPEIASELGVDNILEGSVLKVGGRVRISVKLIAAKVDRSVWAETYDREMSDILALQSEVSRAIVRETQVQLTPQEQARLDHARLIAPEVYEAYLKGRYEWNRRNLEGTEKAIAYFEQAIAKDSTYAPAYAGLADSYIFLSFLRSSPEAPSKARSAVLKALALDEALPEAHATLGHLRFSYDWDWAGAEREFQRALALNPNYATAHHWYWLELAALGRSPEAQREIELARELDPFSVVIEAASVQQLRLMGQRDVWETRIREFLSRNPGYNPSRVDLAAIIAAEGRQDEACREYEKVLSAKKLGKIAQEMEQTRSRSGPRTAFEEAARSLAALAPNLPVSPTEIAWLFSAAGQRDLAFEWIEKAYVRRTPNITWLGIGAQWESLRGDPRYWDLLRRVGLPQRPERRPMAQPAGDPGRDRLRLDRELEAVAHPRVDRPLG